MHARGIGNQVIFANNKLDNLVYRKTHTIYIYIYI